MSTQKRSPRLLAILLSLLPAVVLVSAAQVHAAPALQPRGLRTPKAQSPKEEKPKVIVRELLVESQLFYVDYLAHYVPDATALPSLSAESTTLLKSFIKEYVQFTKYDNDKCKGEGAYTNKDSACYGSFSAAYLEHDQNKKENWRYSIHNKIYEIIEAEQAKKLGKFKNLASMAEKYNQAKIEYITQQEAHPNEFRDQGYECESGFTTLCVLRIGRMIIQQERQDREATLKAISKSRAGALTSTAAVSGGISGMAWQTALFTGLADYLVERAGDELALWLIQTFYKDLCQKHPDWFPESCGLLVSVKDPTEELPGEVPGLLFSAAIRKDLERFPVVAVRAAYNARSSVIPLVVELSKKDLTKERLVALLKDFAEKAKLQEACSSDPKDPLCVGIALGVALEYLKDAIQEQTFPGNKLCLEVKKRIEDKKKGVEAALLEIFKEQKRIPPGLRALIALGSDEKTTWSCQDSSPWVNGADASAKSATAILSILEQIQLAYQGIEKFQKSDSKSQQALQQFVLDNAGHATEVLIQAAKLDGRESLRSAEVTLRAGNLVQNAFLPFVSALLRKDLNKDTWIKLLRSAADLDTLTSACKDTLQRPICMFAAFGVSLKFLVDDVLTKDEFPGNAICTQLQDEVKNGTLKNKLIALFGNETHLPPGLKSLVAVSQDGKLTWSCLAAAPWVDGMDSSAGVPKAAVGLIAELHAMYRGFVGFEKASHSEIAQALQKLLFANARHAEMVVYLATIIDGRPELKATANGVLVAMASTDVIEALFSLFVQLRNGTPPVELLAGLADLSRKSELPKLLCQSPETRNDIACTLVATGTLVAEFGGVSELLTKERWDEASACTITKGIAGSKNLKGSLNELFGELPPTLKDLLAQTIKCEEGDWHQAESVAKLRALLRTVFELESQINTWRKSGAPPARERVGQLMALLSGVLHAAADLLDQDENARVIKAEKVLTILGDMFNANYVEGVRGSLALLALYKDALPDSIRRYIPLIADLANAQDARGVQNALRAATAPLGSWKRKFSRVTVSVSAIVGGQGGLEMALAKPFGINLQDGLYGGPMAALGLEVGGPVPHGNPRAEFSMSGFLSVIDVGQLALARTTNTGDLSGGGMMPNQQVEASIASNIDLLDVLAPGLYWKFGFKAIPLTFGFGPTFAPRLRKYSYTDADKIVRTADPLSMIRLNMFIGVDLNLFPIR